MASATSAPTAGERGLPLTVTRQTCREKPGESGRASTPSCLTLDMGMKASPSPAATIARIQSSRSLS